MSPSNESFCNTRREPEAASLSVMRPSSTLSRDMVSASGLKGGRQSRPIDGAGAVEPETDPRRAEANLACLHLAAHEWRKPDFKLDGAGTQARRTACLADLDIAQIDTRARQDARVDRTVDVDGEAGQPARLLLE